MNCVRLVSSPALYMYVFALVSCAKLNSSGDVSILDLDEKNIQGYSSEAKCANLDECPSQVALIAMPKPEKNGGGYCSGTMISEDVLITNGHCLAEGAREDGASCENKMWISFPENKEFKAKVVECESVLFVSKYDHWSSHSVTSKTIKQPDFAVLKLKTKPERGFIPIDREGFSEGDTVDFFKSNPNLDDRSRFGSEIVKRTCKVSKKAQIKLELASETQASSTSYLKTAPTIGFEDCYIRGGNSGTAAIAGGRVKGVLFAGGSDLAYMTNFGQQESESIASFVDALMGWGILQ